MLITRCLVQPVPGNTWDYKRRAVMNAPHRVDVADQLLNRLSGEHRMCNIHFCDTGVLLPFSSSDEEYKISNP